MVSAERNFRRKKASRIKINRRAADRAGDVSVTEATYVSFVPRSKRTELRHMLQSEDTGPISWTEKKMLLGSEFYFSGPASLVRKTHTYITQWLARD
jgi:hypothetical protein